MDDKIAQVRTMIVIVELVRLRDASVKVPLFREHPLIVQIPTSKLTMRVIIVQQGNWKQRSLWGLVHLEMRNACILTVRGRVTFVFA